MKTYRIVDDKGRFVIPKTLRDLSGIQAGDVVLLEQHEEGILIRNSQFIDLKNSDESLSPEVLTSIVNSLNTQQKQKFLKELIESEVVK